MDNLSALLGISDDLTAAAGVEDLVESPPEVPTVVVSAEVVDADIPQDEKDLNEDLQIARKNIKDIAERAAKAAQAAILLAESGDSSKAFEAVARMTEAIVTANKELIEIHRTRKETLRSKPNGKGSLLPDGDNKPINIEKAVFVGRASDLLRELRQMEKDQKAISNE